jgi:ABC-type polar amino acid transport system ATPase subunit
MSFIDIRGISKSYGDVPVIKRLAMTVNEHDVVCLIGPSGSGKSTLLRCINGLELIDDGEILVHGDGSLAQASMWTLYVGTLASFFRAITCFHI